MPDDGGSRWEPRIWAVLGVLAPAIIVLGCLGIVVGVATGQNLLLVGIDVMVAVVGGILLLLLRWR